MYKYVLNFQGNPIYLFLNPFISLFDSVCLLQTVVSGISVSLSTTEGCIKYICQFAFYRRLYQVYLLVSVYYRGLYQVCLPVCLLQTAVSSISASLSTEEGCIRYICQFVYYKRLFQVCLSLCLL